MLKSKDEKKGIRSPDFDIPIVLIKKRMGYVLSHQRELFFKIFFYKFKVSTVLGI